MVNLPPKAWASAVAIEFATQLIAYVAVPRASAYENANNGTLQGIIAANVDIKIFLWRQLHKRDERR
jgi:hypothetical protein